MSSFAPTYSPHHTHNQRGASMLEYALLVALVALVAVIGIRAVGVGARDKFIDTSRELSTPASGDLCTPGNPSYPDCLP